MSESTQQVQRESMEYDVVIVGGDRDKIETTRQ